ncbi:hypothetical protein D3C81_1478610 [compost metagenome]
MHRLPGSVVQGDVGQLRAALVEVAGQGAQQPEQQAGGQACSEWATHQGLPAVLPGSTGQHRQQAGPSEEASIANVNDLHEVVAILRPVGDHEAQSRSQQAEHEQHEQSRFGVVAATPGHAPAHQGGQAQGTEQ